ncbi:hypothetical protein L211DRAFT_818299 [Terfezia boudieri ATCC MYA-4762]|uniref:MYND-type domain-containing protein n=1 Tax=Terfezia boudieri ATCC MYA-4762 TaxID=1051890 RepID=A0A3N4M0I4_9PEZI|nr:hypothetical protein L211DRAFT_818299 [Terfezia boudieri ATCC MYA-4762]
MLHPAYINLNYFFYPTGTTPATCLTQDLPPERPANILVLNCGDPRNILFTLYNSDPDCSRVVDFTCCESEPAVLARNVLLFSLIIDDRNTGQDNSNLHWNIFYHLLLDEPSLQLLQRQSKKLLEISMDETLWRHSGYGNVLRMVSKDTLQQLRNFWTKYADTANYSEGQMKSYEAQYKEGWERIRRNYVGTTRVISGCRTAGPLWMESTRASDLSLKRYWKTGVAGGDEGDLTCAKHANPAFAFSSAPHGAFSVHYGTDPLLGFHSVTSYTNVVTASKAPTPEEPEGQVNRVVLSAKAQFSSWCESFKAHTAANLVSIRFFCGEATSFCLALQERNAMEILRDFAFGFGQPWRTTLLKLDGSDYDGPASPSAPLTFDVIDTAGLSDQIGLLSILVCTAPLLIKKPSSVIYTETLLHSSEEETSELSKILFGDLTTVTVLLNLAPLGHLTAIASQASFHEAGILLSGSSPNSRDSLLHTRIPWKEPVLGDPLAAKYLLSSKCVFADTELAALLSDIYLRMFSHEANSPLTYPETGFTRSTSGPKHFTRATFAAFLRYVKGRAICNWAKVLDAMIVKICSYKSAELEPNGIQDLFLHSYLFGVSEDLRGRRKGHSILSGLPEITCIVLTVPRKTLTLFTRMNRRDMGMLAFCASVRSQDAHHTFASVQPIFGKAALSKDRRSFTIQEDLRGWTGISDMVVSFWVPSHILYSETESSLKVCLELVNASQAISIFSIALGPQLTIFEASLSDSAHVTVCTERSGIKSRVIPEELVPLVEQVIPPSYAGLRVGQVGVTLSSMNEIDKFKVRLDYHNGGKEHAALKLGSSVDIKQDSPCTVLLGISGCKKHRLAFPYPVNTLVHTLRVSRKAAWIELLVSPSVATDIAGYSLHTLPVINDNACYLVWNIPYIPLNTLPVLDTSRTNNFDRWVNQHVSNMWSDRERKIRNDGEQMDVKMELKESIQTIFLQAAGLGPSGKPERVFSLCAPEHGGNHMLIFVADLRLDLSSQTAVVDAYVLPLTEEVIARYPRRISRIYRDGIVNIRIGEGELTGWKDMMPAIAERCRTWKHTPACEYRVSGIPVSIAMGQSPLCSCGLGVVGDEFVKQKEWEPFRKHVTRIALSPLFAVSYIERTTTGMVKGLNFFLDAQELTTRESFTNLVQDNVCQNCGLEAGGAVGLAVGSPVVMLTKCNRCKTAMYCSQACQKQDWKKHRAECL